jgi:hypothetical protein
VNIEEKDINMLLKTLEEHNNRALEAHTLLQVGSNNGIECPNCKCELFDSQHLVLLSNPPRYKIFYKNCDYTGERY